jgi:hypothetical protein
VLVTCWSVKGGSGTTVVATGLAVLLARRLPQGERVLLVDGGGDAPAVLGAREPTGPGWSDWLDAADVDGGALRRLEVEVAPQLDLLPIGRGPRPEEGSADRLLGGLAGRGVVVVDAGVASPFAFGLAAGSTMSLLVIRPCYLALRRALAAPVRPSSIVVVEDGKRALDALDIEDVLGAPVRTVVPWDAAIARCVDAGLLAARLPGALASALRAAA